MIDFQTTDDERLLWETAARFGLDQLRPGERDHEKARAYPDSLREAYTELGFAGLGVPEAFGGAGLDVSQRLGAWMELAAGDPAAPLGLSPTGPGGFALAETELGRELLESRRPGAVVYAGDVVIDGRERATGTLDWVPRQPGGVAWLALLDDSGLYLVREPKAALTSNQPCGLRATGGVRIELDHVPCERIGGVDLAREVMSECRLFAAACALGAARDAHLGAAKYGQERIAFGKPIAHHQGLAFQLADCATDLEAARLLLEAAANHACWREIASAYAYAVEVSQRVAERSVQVYGGHGYLYDHRIEKRMRDIRALTSLYGGRIGAEIVARATVFDLPDPLEVGS